MESRVAVVTGASRGIGRRIAERLHGSGYHVLTASRSGVEVPEDRWDHVAVDLGTPSGIEELSNHRLCRSASVLVNNVGGIYSFGGLEAEAAEVVRETFETNVFGPVELMRQVVPLMASGGGVVVNISSIYGPVSPAPPVLSYAASKAALAAVTASLALEWAPHGVRINAVLPGCIDTEMTRGGGDEYVNEVVERTPIGRLGQPDDVARCVEFLISSPFVVGHLLVVDGGIALVGG